MFWNSQVSVWIFVIIFSKTTNLVVSGQYFDIKIEHLNKQLIGYNLFDMTDLSHHKCVTECMFIGACVSVNFITSTKTCELNSADSDTVNPEDFVEAPGIIFSDISVWPQSMAKGCANHHCNNLQRCYPFGNGGHECVYITCEHPSNSQYGVIQSGLTNAGTVRTYTFKCPENMFVNGNTSITCQENGKWTQLEATCTVATIGAVCTGNTDCKETVAVCNQGYCFCNRLYRRDAGSKDCVQVCTSMTDTFSVTNGMRVLDFNDLGTSKETLSDCHTLCINDANCSSFEYNTITTGCRRGSLSKQMAEDALPHIIKFDNEDVDFYQRDCL